MLWQLFLQKTPKSKCGGKRVRCSSQRQQSVRIYRLKPDRAFFCSRVHHARKKEGREVVGDHDASPLGHRRKQSLRRADRRLDVRKIKRAGRGKLPRVCRHAFEHEAVQPLAGPRIIAAQRFEDEHRFAQLAAPFHRAIQRKIPARPAERDHPVEDVVAACVDGCWVERANAHERNSSHNFLRNAAAASSARCDFILPPDSARMQGVAGSRVRASEDFSGESVRVNSGPNWGRAKALSPAKTLAVARGFDGSVGGD